MLLKNGIDYLKYENSIKDELSSPIIISMIASMRDAKDQDTVIKALSLMGDNYQLRLVGDGPRREDLKILAEEYNVNSNVVFMGNQNDIPKILKESDIVILSSHWEGLSLASLEGMASGRPFIASDVQGLTEIVGGYGVVFPENDYKALKDEIQMLCNNITYYKEVAARCQERAKQFDIRVMAEKYNDIYNSL